MTVDEFAFPAAYAFGDSTSPSSADSVRASIDGGGLSGNGGVDSNQGLDTSGKTRFVLVKEDVCLGFIKFSAKTRVCLKISCEVYAHREEKLGAIMGQTVLIQVPKKIDQAFAVPAALIGDLPSEVPKSLKGFTGQADVLRAMVLTHQGFKHELANSSPSTPDSKQESSNSFSGGDRILKTPAKLQRFMEPTTEEMHEALGAKQLRSGVKARLNMLAEADVAQDEETKYDLKMMSEAVLKLNDTTDTLRSSVVTLTSRVSIAFDKTNKHLFNGNKAIHIIDARVGPTPSDFGAATICDAVLINKEEGRSIRASMEGITQSSSRSISKLEDKMLRTFSTVGDNFQQLGKSLEERLHAVLGNQTTDGPHNTGYDQSLSNLESEQLLYQQQTSSSLRQMSDTIDSLRLRLTDAEEKADKLANQSLDASAFRSDDYTFSSMDDVLKFVRKHNISSLAGCMDSFTAFVIMVVGVQSGEEHARSYTTSMKAHRTQEDSDLLASFSHMRPPYFFSSSADLKNGRLVDHNKGFGALLPSYFAYDENMNSQKSHITLLLEDLGQSYSSLRDMSTPEGRLKGHMTRLALQHCERVLSYMTNYQRSLTTASNYPSKEAWLLVGRCVSRYFGTLQTLRAKAQRVSDLSSEADRALVIWTLMQSLNRSQEIIERGFQSHPSIMKEVMEFQLEHRVDSSQLQAVSDEVKAVKSSMKTVTDSMTKVERLATDAGSKALKATQDVGNMRTELNKIKKA